MRDGDETAARPPQGQKERDDAAGGAMVAVSTERVHRRGPFPVRFRVLEVRRVEHVTPRMLRVTLGGDELEGFQSEGADDHVKLAFPAPGTDEIIVPVLGPGGPTFPADRPRPALRDYTPRRYDPARRELAVDFVLHGDGPAASWAASARPGSRVGVGGPRGSLVVAQDFDWYLLVGDESALPAIGRRIEELPAGARAIAVVEVEDAAEEQRFETRGEVRVLYVHRAGAAPAATERLLEAVRALEFPRGEYFAWVAGESGAVRAVRDHLLAERGARREWMRAAGYWKRGVAGHHD